MYDIFISYSHLDQNWVARLANTLETHGYKVWWDRELLPSQDYGQMIEAALNASKCTITVWSTNSVKSKWVRAESGRSFNQEKLLPVLLEDAEVPIPFDSVQTADLRTWKGNIKDQAFIDLLNAIEWHLSNKEAVKAPVPAKNASRLWLKPKLIKWILGVGLLLSMLLFLSLYYGSVLTEGSVKQSVFTPPTTSVTLISCEQPNEEESIIQASGRGHINRVKQCIYRGVDVNFKDGNQWTPLHAAAYSGQLSIVKLLVSHGADIHAEANSRRTPLYLAVMTNKYDVVHYLKKNGAAVDKADATGALPFSRANEEMKKILMPEE